MADVQSNETGNMESNRSQETVSKSYCLLRPSAFSSSATSASRDTESSRENESTSQTPSRFQLRPSMLDKQAASLFNKDVSSSPTVRGSASFKLEPPKLCSPLSCKFTDNNKPSLLRPGSQLLGNSEPAPTGSDGATPVSGASDGSTTVPAAASTDLDNATQEPASASHLLKVSPLPPTEAAGFLFGQQLDARVVTTSSEQPVATSGVGLPSVSSLSGSTVTTATTTTSSAVASGFVFGSNLAERVLAPVAAADHTATSGSGGGASDNASHSQPDTAANSADTSSSVTGASEPATTSLEESAALQQAKHSHIQLNEVEVVTGEEDESNVFQFNVKLFVFEKKTQSWLERGVGHLRLNDKCGPCDSGSFQSRLVLRIFGSLRVVLNTMIWADMLIERATQKSIKISAVDPEEGIRIYLIQANPSDADHIYSAISSRAHKLKLAEATRRSPAVGAAAAAATGAGATPLHDSPSGTASASSSATSVATVSTPASEKRSSEVLTDSDTFNGKRRRVDPEQRREQVEDESNDSSAVDPETEASNEGFSSSPPIQSSSSEA